MSRSLVGIHALVVEDHDDSRLIMEQCLQHAGAAVMLAASAREALTALASGNRFDVVITDYSMPGDTGLWLLERIRERQTPIPVIVVTGYADLHANQLKRAPFARVLRKPVDPDRLCEEIVAVLSEAR